MKQLNQNVQSRVLVLPPTRRDGEVTGRLLSKSGVNCALCDDALHLANEITEGAGAVLVTEKLASSEHLGQVLDALSNQEAWSDLPFVVLLHAATPGVSSKRLLSSLTNVTLLERPALTATVISAVQAALRARDRQYQIRELLESEEAARKEGEHSNRMKDEFLATLSHELRTPLNAIFGWVQILKLNPSDRERVIEAADIIDRNVRVQTKLIEDLLDMSRIISGKIRLDIQRVELKYVIQAAVESAAPAVNAKGIKLETMIDPQLEPVDGDYNRLQQVLWNLLTNASKFTPKNGRIQIRAEGIDSQIVVSVTDTGEGIDPDFLPHIFERFSQADGSITRHHGGLGLGLSIVKHLVELHGGTVMADSQGFGKGATFVVRLPLRTEKADSLSALHPTDTESTQTAKQNLKKLRGVKVLVVDDEPDARELVKRFLVANKAIPVLASSAAEATYILRDFQPDVIVSDIGMAGEDGYEFIRKIREDGVTTPAIALTAFARAEDRLRSIRSGYQSHLQKPVEPSELLALIIRLHDC